MVFQDQCIPPLPVRRSLRIKKSLLKLAQVKWFGEEFLSPDIVRVKMPEAEDRVQLAIALADIFPCIFLRRMEGLPYGTNIVKGK